MVLTNISFIVIARNEAFAVEKCLGSIASMPLKECEVICVDSDSTDNTLDVIKGYIDKIENIRIIQCSGYVSAAVARNAGLSYATKQYIFFVDGDVELYPDFIFKALERIKVGKADAVTGKLLEIQYSSDYKSEIRRLVRRKTMTEEKRCLMTGGIFIAKKEIVNEVGAWHTGFVQFEDFDYTLRIARCRTLLQLPQFIGIHHTQEFHDRSWEHYRKGYPLLYGKLLRRNLYYPQLILHLLRSNKDLLTFLVFVFVLLMGLLVSSISSLPLSTVILFGGIYLLLDFSYSIGVKMLSVNQWVLRHYLTPPLVLYGLIAKYRCKPVSTEIKVIT